MYTDVSEFTIHVLCTLGYTHSGSSYKRCTL